MKEKEFIIELQRINNLVKASIIDKNTADEVNIIVPVSTDYNYIKKLLYRKLTYIQRKRVENSNF